ncbi:hypothetical protein HK098_003332 [Nowakowskiella sp. JEL0407]|nr:hypothetical protein HK098_003332 [Nowakowskiella sp. JEL0407]
MPTTLTVPDKAIYLDNEVLESVERHVSVFAHFKINELMQEYPAEHRIECDKKNAIYETFKSTVNDNDRLLKFVRMESLPYPLGVKKLEIEDGDEVLDVSPLRAFTGTPSISNPGWESKIVEESKKKKHSIVVEINQDPAYYQYEVSTNPNEVEFYVSFADRALFGWFHKKNLPLASEEVRALEFPVVCSLRYCLEDISDHGIASDKWKKVFPDNLGAGTEIEDVYQPKINESTYQKYQPVTSNGSNLPTPIILEAVPRMGHLKVGKNALGPSDEGIYGDRFINLEKKDIKDRLTKLDPPHKRINLICMEALEQKANPEVRSKAYSTHQLRTLLRTAVTGFAGARALMEPEGGGYNWKEMIINTGLWGCGEYGNNPGVICLIQLAAAHFLGYVHDSQPGNQREKPAISRLIFYVGTSETTLIEAGFKIFYDVWNSPEIVRKVNGSDQVIPELFLENVQRKLAGEEHQGKFHWLKKNNN